MADHKGTIVPIKKIFEKDTFRIYICKPLNHLDFDGMYDISISGQIPDLLIGVQYDVVTYSVVKEKYGKGFVLTSILPHKGLKNSDSMYAQYLNSCTSENIAKEILRVYPKFVNMIIDGKVDEIDTSKIRGVGIPTLHTIKDKILAKIRIMEVIEEYSQYGITFRVANAIFEKCYQNVDLLREKMNANPYSLLCSVPAVGFKTADEIILKFKPELIDSDFRLVEAFKYILSQNEDNGNSYMQFKEMYGEAFKLSPEAIKHANNITRNHRDFHFNPDLKTIAFKKTYEKEYYIAKRLVELKNASVDWGKTEPDYELFRKVGKFDMTDEQIKVLPSIFNNNCVLLAGNAGTGKSSSTIGLLNFLDSIHKSYTLLCPTGAASEVLSRATAGRETSTIHKEIHRNKKLMEENPEDGRVYIYSDVVLVDESSMINIDLLYDLLYQVEDGTKIIFVGDPQQLPPIGAGLCFDDIIKSNLFASCKLTHVFRYSEGGLATFIENVRVGNTVFKDGKLDKVTQYGKQKDLAVIHGDSQEDMLKDVVNIYMSALNGGRDIMDIIIASPQNVGVVGTVAINKLIQDRISSGKPFITFGTSDFKLGDKVYQNVNCYDRKTINGGVTNIFNSNQGFICDIYPDDKMLVVDFKGRKIEYKSEELKQLNLAYAVSVHKLQGSGYPIVLAIGSSSHTFMLNRNLIYTQLTRASEKVYYFIDKTSTINRAVKKYENVIRNTCLVEFLNENNIN